MCVCVCIYIHSILIPGFVIVHSGGISLKPPSGMDAMRADMGGAATVCAALVTAVALKLPINIIGKPVGSNMEDPGDVSISPVVLCPLLYNVFICFRPGSLV